MKSGHDKSRFRTDAVVPASETDTRALPRSADDDFFCVRFQVWYPSLDCAVRTRFRTSAGCLQCDQGRFNERRHAAALADMRFHFADADAADDPGEGGGHAGQPEHPGRGAGSRRDR